MNFYQAPITRYLSLDTLGTTSLPAIGPIPQGFSTTAPVINVSAWKSGRVVNVFFETPCWPSSTFSINIEYNNTTTSAPLLAAPNVMISNPEANYFIRGNASIGSAFAAAAANITYCGVLTNVKPVNGNARASAVNSAWVQPADYLEIAASNGHTATNISSNSTAGIKNFTVLATRIKNNSDSFLIEFNACIRTDGNDSGGNAGIFTDGGGYVHLSGSGTANAAAYDVSLKYATAPTFRRLAQDGLSIEVLGKDASDVTIFTATLSSVANLTFPANNKAGLISSYFNPSRFTQVSSAWATANLRPLASAGTAIVSHRLSIDRDDVSGGEPYRCLALVYPAGAANPPQVAITINPIS